MSTADASQNLVVLLAELEAERDAAAAKLDALERAVEALRPAVNGSGSAPGAKTGTLGIGEERLEMIETYVRERGNASQPRVGKDLDLNSGAVSVALRVLEAQGKVERIGKSGRAQLWRWVDGGTEEAE